MSTVNLDDEEWQRVMAVIAQAPWNVANPLLMKIGEQLRAQQAASLAEQLRQQPGNSKLSHEEIQRTLDESAPIQRRPI